MPRALSITLAVAVLSAQNRFDVVLEGGALEQIGTRKTSNPNVVAEAVFDFLSATDNQLSGNAPIIENLPVELGAEIVTQRVSWRTAMSCRKFVRRPVIASMSRQSAA